jgi:hypothetical protein
MSASRRQTRSQGARPPEEDPNQINLIQQKEMNQIQNLQEEEEHLNSKEGQEATKEGILRKENQRISTSCHNMLTQEVIRKNLMQVIMKIWIQINKTKLKISKTQCNSLMQISNRVMQINSNPMLEIGSNQILFKGNSSKLHLKVSNNSKCHLQIQQLKH